MEGIICRATEDADVLKKDPKQRLTVNKYRSQRRKFRQSQVPGALERKKRVQQLDPSLETV
jgi:hypothetical protein